MALPKPRKDITKLLISTPSHFGGSFENDTFRVVTTNQNVGVKTARRDERIYRQYLEITVETPEYQYDTVVIPDYSQIGENFCIALSVLFGKVFESHGVLQQHGRAYLPDINSKKYLHNKNLTFNSSSPRVDFGVDLNLENIKYIQDVLYEHDELTAGAQSTFWYAGRFYIQSLRIVEENPELAFLSLITAGEILASYFKYSSDELLDSSSKELLESLKSMGDVGENLHRQVSKKLMGISESFCKFLIDCLDDEFFERSESKLDNQKLTKNDIKQRLKAAYNLRSKYVHAGKTPSGWMSVDYLNANEEVIAGSPVLSDPDMKRTIKRSPTFVGMERIIRYSLLKFVMKTEVIGEI